MYIHKYPDRVQLQEDGVYRWNCRIDKKYEQRIYRITMIACGIIAVFVLAFGIALSMMSGSIGDFGIVAGCVAVFLLITVAVCWFMDKVSSDPHEIYEMTEEYVQTGSGRSKEYFTLKKTKKLLVTEKYIELKGDVRSMRLYVPQDDLEFVRGYIMNRVPPEAIGF